MILKQFFKWQYPITIVKLNNSIKASSVFEKGAPQRAGTGLIRLDYRLPSPRPATLSLQISYHWQYFSFMQRESRVRSLTVVYQLRQRLLWYFFHISRLFDCEYISALSHFLQGTCDYWPPPRCYPQEVVRVGPCHRGVSPHLHTCRSKRNFLNTPNWNN